jgi:quercetin dioxygenase-like cupin family protein
MESVGETESVLGTIALHDVNIAPGGRNLIDKSLRLNKVEVEPGGIVSFHSHLHRPAIMYIAEGSIVEYNSNHEMPIFHSVGSVSIEFNDVAHWWKNETDKNVVIYSAMLVDA